ncbi:MAG: hypothetical protein ACO3F2_01700 [Roseiflexaceae bacterium]
MVHDGTVKLTQNRRWAWGVLILTIIILAMRMYEAHQQAALTWPALLMAGGLTAVMIWVTWPMLPDWRFDTYGIHRGRLLKIQWSDVQEIDVRIYAHAMRHPGSIDVVMRSEDTVVRLRMYCRDEAQQVVGILDSLLPVGCNRTALSSAIARTWPVRREE